MIWVARVVLALSAVMTVAFDPRVFFGSGQGGGWISFASWFHDGSWWAFRLAIAALVLYGIAAATSDPAHRVSWREPVIAGALVAWALVRGVPHSANVSSWARGDVGALAWLRAERGQRDQEEIAIGPEVFAGSWRAADGTIWRFGPNDATRDSPDSASTPSPASKRARCTGPYRVAYLERGRDVFVERGVDSSAHASAVLAALPARARVAVASVACSEEPWSAEFVRVSDGEIWLFEPWMTTEEMRADAFVLRRETR
ncbi:MAG TPA: hypothetical protein VM076_25900 [Gemmatimonadaceae bacterium]|nr:hypothetical protein [Gemmatimonadaceae bacterium]